MISGFNLSTQPHLYSSSSGPASTMSPSPKPSQPSQVGTSARSPSPEETPDVVPSRVLTGEEAAQDYQQQLAVLSEQETVHRAEQTSDSRSRSPSPEETPDVIPDRVLSAEEAEADYQEQLAMLRRQNAEYAERQQAGMMEEEKSGGE
ncbi:hypothetical protein E4U55_001424 [Claviceps digitariae]|nr:hypothetical protein E4U55_001424 [Claviceps digitariae]